MVTLPLLCRLLLFLPRFLAAGAEDGCGGDGACEQPVPKADTEKPLGQSPDSLTEFNQLDSRRRASNSSVAAKLIHFAGLTDSKTLDRSCCNNGGTCILGSFCACPPPFIGRYCELDQSLKSCGKFMDGQWVLKHCTWCICSYGNLHCLEAFGKVENCDADEDRHLNESYDVELGLSSGAVPCCEEACYCISITKLYPKYKGLQVLKSGAQMNYWRNSTGMADLSYVPRERAADPTYDLRTIWEKKIEKQTEWLEQERLRLSRSALSRLIKEWTSRVESKKKLMQTILEDDRKKQRSALSIETPVLQVPSSA